MKDTMLVIEDVAIYLLLQVLNALEISILYTIFASNNTDASFLGHSPHSDDLKLSRLLLLKRLLFIFLLLVIYLV